MDPKPLLEKLLEIQRKLKVGKNKHNDFDGFDYRSKSDILEAVKPCCEEYGLVLVCDDEMLCLDNGWAYVVSTATLTDIATGETVCAHGVAREQESRPKMDASQLTGGAASYAGKYALGNLFALDDTKDADGMDNSKMNMPDRPVDGSARQIIGTCMQCGTRYTFLDAAQMASYMCQNCGCKEKGLL